MGATVAKGRGKPTRRAGARRKAPPKTTSPAKPLAMIAALLIGFGLFLYGINGQRNQSLNPEVAPATAELQTPAKAAPTAPPLPAKPREEWRYIDELVDKTVEVDVSPVEKKPSRPYLMQCGSFRRESQANQLKARIAFQGLHSQVRRSEGKNGVWYRVVLGPYDRKRQAESDRHKLSRAKVNGCAIWFWS